MAKPDTTTDHVMTHKRCPECFTKLPLTAKKCPACNQKVEDVDKYGLAKKPLNWSGYFVAIGLWVLLGLYIYWAFFMEN